MAKRKRLSPAVLTDAAASVGAGLPDTARRRPPIADVSGDAARHSAFEDMAQGLTAARAEGRMIARLPLEAIDEKYLVRDRMVAGREDMAELKSSLRARVGPYFPPSTGSKAV